MYGTIAGYIRYCTVYLKLYTNMLRIHLFSP